MIDRTRLTFLCAALAGLLGAGGVALSAAATHLAAGQTTAIAAGFLLLHALALLALAAIALAAPARAGGFLLAAALLFLGALVFCGDLAARGFGGGRLFPMAAPIGGSTLVFGWLAVAVAGARAFSRRNQG